MHARTIEPTRQDDAAAGEQPAPLPTAGLGATFVSMSDAEALALARTHFGRDGSVTRLSTEKDDTYRLETGGGERFILKVANPHEDPQELDFQLGLLLHIARVDPSMPVPRLIPSTRGRHLVRFTDRAAQVRCVRMMTHLDGTVLDSTDSTAGEREMIGEVLARLRFATAAYRHPVEDRVLPWDVRHLPKLSPLLSHIDDPQQNALLRAGLRRFESLADEVLGLRRQVVHNDFSKSNIVVDHASPSFVEGIIDFGDAVKTAVAIDVSTALLNQLPRNLRERPVDDIFAEPRDVLRGYLRRADLTRRELELIPHLVMARVIARALLSIWRARMFPDNTAYLLRNTEQGWAQLEWFLDRDPKTVSETLLDTSA